MLLGTEQAESTLIPGDLEVYLVRKGGMAGQMWDTTPCPCWDCWEAPEHF